MKKLILSLALASTMTTSIACDIDGKTGFAPENDLSIPVNQFSVTGISHEDFDQVIDDVIKVYKPIIESHGDTFIVNRKWKDGKVNASAIRKGKKVVVNMYGGLARHEMITKDGFAVVLCHELGHHLGGAPKIKTWGRAGWASNEGQSDYFGTLKCFRKVYGNDDNISFNKTITVHPIVTKKCNAAWTNEKDRALCVRSAMAAKSTTDLLGTLSRTGKTDFTKTDMSQVSKTNDKHPAAQCRLDTYMAGVVCYKDMDTELSTTDADKGTCNRKDGDIEGVRPLCWFKPKK